MNPLEREVECVQSQLEVLESQLKKLEQSLFSFEENNNNNNNNNHKHSTNHNDKDHDPIYIQDERELKGLKQEWSSKQIQLKSFLVEKDDLDFELPDEVLSLMSEQAVKHYRSQNDKTQPKKSLKFIGGVDISFVKDNDTACAALVIVRFPDFEVVYEKYELIHLTLPYISGFLAFREVPFLIRLIEDLKRTKPHLFPDLIMVDGNGILHPRSFGLASHFGVLCDVPTIGVGKSFLQLDGLTVHKVRDMERQLHFAGASSELIGDSGKIWGALLRGTEESSRAIFISVGHRFSLDSALALCKYSCRVRVPEPVRQADLRSREWIRHNYKPHPMSPPTSPDSQTSHIHRSILKNSGNSLSFDDNEKHNNNNNNNKNNNNNNNNKNNNNTNNNEKNHNKGNGHSTPNGKKNNGKEEQSNGKQESNGKEQSNGKQESNGNGKQESNGNGNTKKAKVRNNVNIVTPTSSTTKTISKQMEIQK